MECDALAHTTPVRCGCGGEAVVHEHEYGEYEVYCPRCFITTDDYATEAEAIEAWNRAMGGVVVAKNATTERTAKVTMDLRCVDGIAYQQHFCSSCGNSLDIPQIGKSPDWKPNYCKSCGARLEWK